MGAQVNFSNPSRYEIEYMTTSSTGEHASHCTATTPSAFNVEHYTESHAPNQVQSSGKNVIMDNSLLYYLNTQYMASVTVVITFCMEQNSPPMEGHCIAFSCFGEETESAYGIILML